MTISAKTRYYCTNQSKPHQGERVKKLTDKAIAEIIDVDQVTFSRWKTSRPELYSRIKQSFEYEAKIKEIESKLNDVIQIVKIDGTPDHLIIDGENGTIKKAYDPNTPERKADRLAKIGKPE